MFISDIRELQIPDHPVKNYNNMIHAEKSIQYILIFLLAVCCSRSKPELYDVKVENLKDPLGIDNPEPRFSWKIKSGENDTKQTAYQVLVSQDPSVLEENKGDLWDSEKISSSESILIPYNGKIPGSGSIAYWKARIWDESGRASSWSAVSEFSTGLLTKDDWEASYICYRSEAGFKECPQLMKSFELTDTSGRYLLYVNSLGYHEIFVNGSKAGDAVLTPAVSQFNKRSLVITYDISRYIKQGHNSLIIWLGSGWYTEGLPGVVNSGPVVKAQLERINHGKREMILKTDESWVGRKSEYTREGTWRPWEFGGEILNGNLAGRDISSGIKEERMWEPVTLVDVPDHEVSPQMTEPNRIRDTIKPVEIKLISENQYLIDMGKNLAGWFEIHFTELNKDQEILIEYSDHLDKNGNFSDQKQYDRYIASGKGNEYFINKFNYHGFRYVRVSNLQKSPVPDSIRAFLIHTDYQSASGFTCSDPDLNQIHDMIRYTLRCLSPGGYLVDCPQIERLGYGGDGNASTQTAQTMFDLYPLYSNWLQAWKDCIREDGGMPHTAPNPYPAGGGPYWCGFIITAAWNTFMSYGDTLILEKYYPTMQKWLEYVDKYTVNGLLTRWPDNDYRGWYLGDWAAPDGVDVTAETSINLINNCFISLCFDCMRKIAGVLNKPAEVIIYTEKRDELRKNIHHTFYNGSGNIYATGSQLDLTYPLLADVVPDEYRGAVKKSLLDEILINRNGHFACGLVGVPVFTEWTVKNREADLMYSMLKKRTCPGYLYMIDNGGTTTWEYWHGDRSYIHNCYNGIGSWFYKAIGGIQTDENYPAYSKVIIHPQIPEGVTWAKTWKETPYGQLVVNWELKNNKMEMELEIPPGVNADVVIPSGISKYQIGRKEYITEGDGDTKVSIGSGRYLIMYGRNK